MNNETNKKIIEFYSCVMDNVLNYSKFRESEATVELDFGEVRILVAFSCN